MDPTFLDAAAVEAALPSVDAVRGVLRDAFTRLAGGGAVQPAQALTLLPGDAGDSITYTGAVADGPAGPLLGVKVSPYLTARPPGERVSAYTLLVSTDTGRPVLLCDSGALTTERTAGTSALAVDLLAGTDAGVLAVIGAGPVAVAHLRHLRAVRAWREIRVFSPSLAAHPGGAVRFGRDVVVARSAAAAVDGADVVACCTSAADTVVEVDWLSRHAVVTSVSTNAASAREVDPAELHRFAVTCDFRATTPLVAGEMVLAARDHGWSPDAVRADLPELLTGAPPPTDGPVLFRSMGLGLEDVAIASLLVPTSDTGAVS